MRSTHIHKRLLVFSCAIWTTAPVDAQSWWGKVPALPHGCYTKGETFDADNVRLQQELQAAIYRQDEIARDLDERLDNIDAATQRARMMAYLKKDPVGAAKYLQDGASDDPRESDARTQVNQRRARNDQQFKATQMQYVNDARPLTPLFASYQNAANPGSTVPSPKLLTLAATYDSAYERFCAKWWVPNGPFVTYLNDLRKMLIDSDIPFGDNAWKSRKLRLDIMGVPTGAYRSTAELRAVKEYLEKARSIYQQRPTQPLRPVR